MIIIIMIIKDGTNIVHEEEEGANTAGPDGGWDDLNDDCEEQREPGFSWKLALVVVAQDQISF